MLTGPPSCQLSDTRPDPLAVPPRLAIAIPARDEEDRLPVCLAAIADQRDAQGRPLADRSLLVVVLANNCADGTAAAARSLAEVLPFRVAVREARFPPAMAHAGGARRVAMDAAAALLDQDGLLLSTDADARPDPSWLAANLAAFAEGADAVAGQVAPDPAEAAALPAVLRRREALEARYASLLDEMAALVDPDPHDPWPRHGVHSGASIALTLAAYRGIGGLPPVPTGEDRALFRALIRAEMRVRHCPAARVVASCRLDGRAPGGMADTLRRRLSDGDDAPVDERLEPALDALLRLRCRRALRRLRAGAPRLGDPLRLAVALGLSPARLRAIVAIDGFWHAWDALQDAAPVLLRRRVPRASALPAEVARAEDMLRALRAARVVVRPWMPPAIGPAAGRADTAASALPA